MYVERVAGATQAFRQRIVPYHPESCDEWVRIYSSTHSQFGSWMCLPSRIELNRIDSDISELKSNIIDITSEILHTITNTDKRGFIASDTNPYYSHDTYIENVGDFYSKLIKLSKGDVLEATLGNSNNIYVLAIVNQNMSFVSSIAKGMCENYQYKAIQDCYVLATTNPSVTAFSGKIHVIPQGEIGVNAYGWKNGYKVAGGADSYNALYILSSPIRLLRGEKLSATLKTSTSAAAIFLRYDDNTYNQIMGIGSDKEYTYSITAQKDGYVYLSTYYPTLAQGNINVSVTIKTVDDFDRSFYSTHGIYSRDFSNFTSMNQFVKYPFSGAIEDNITDRPMNARGILTVEKSDDNFVKQTYYIYYNQLTLVRLLNVDGTPYNEWSCIGNPIYGKKVLGVGDSLMRGNSLSISQTWIGLLQNQYGAITYNKGINGNTLAAQNVETVNPPMVSRISTIHNEIEEIDYFVIIGGANDRRTNVPLGDLNSSDIYTFIGAINSIIDQVREYWPKAHIVFLTNYCRDTISQNTLGLKDIDYVNAMVSACANKHVFCYNNYTNSGVDFMDPNFREWADEGIYKGESANRHFSPEGYKYLLPKYKYLLESN